MTTKTTKMGRPKLPKNEARGKFVSTRVSTPEYTEILKAIKKLGTAKPEWIRRTLLSEARRAVAG
jgi:hypothetical protein